MTRSYRQKRRAEMQDETRRKIVEATIELHQSKGVSATSINDIAGRAGVGRVTVYRHFPDEEALGAACSGTYFERHPLPDPEPWLSIASPADRLRRGLRETYAFYREADPMLSSVYWESRDTQIMAPFFAHFDRAVDVLVAAWKVRGRAKRLLRAGIGLALSYETWHRLTHDKGLSDKQAVDLMMRLTCECPETTDKA